MSLVVSSIEHLRILNVGFLLVGVFFVCGRGMEGRS